MPRQCVGSRWPTNTAASTKSPSGPRSSSIGTARFAEHGATTRPKCRTSTSYSRLRGSSSPPSAKRVSVNNLGAQMGAIDLIQHVARAANRDGARSEADLQSDLRTLLLYGGLSLEDPEVRLE